MFFVFVCHPEDAAFASEGSERAARYACHPEATCLSSLKDLSAPRESTAFFAGE